MDGSNLLPPAPALVLDVGAGSERDAAWLAGKGYGVVAAELSAAMREEAAARHVGADIAWVEDRLPALPSIHRQRLAFQLILLSGVWQNVAPAERERAMRKLLGLLRPGGILALSLRRGPSGAERGVLRLPDDGTGALPLLRHITLNDQKSATYKLGLLRALCRAADGQAGLAQARGDDAVVLPLGLVALNWLRLYLPGRRPAAAGTWQCWTGRVEVRRAGLPGPAGRPGAAARPPGRRALRARAGGGRRAAVQEAPT